VLDLQDDNSRLREEAAATGEASTGDRPDLDPGSELAS
jgi:hypothetical protein